MRASGIPRCPALTHAPIRGESDCSAAGMPDRGTAVARGGLWCRRRYCVRPSVRRLSRRLYVRHLPVYPSVRPSVLPVVCPSVRRLPVCPSVRQFVNPSRRPSAGDAGRAGLTTTAGPPQGTTGRPAALDGGGSAVSRRERPSLAAGHVPRPVFCREPCPKCGRRGRHDGRPLPSAAAQWQHRVSADCAALCAGLG